MHACQDGYAWVQVKEVVRLEGGVKDAETVGVLAWAKYPKSSQLWWPVEILDPFHMPPTRVLPPASTLGEKQRSPLPPHIFT